MGRIESEVQRAVAVVRFALDNAGLLRGEGDAHLHAVALYASITELTGACVMLAEQQHYSGIPIILRSVFEATIDLENLLTDASYVERMTAANLKQVLKMLDSARLNPKLAGLLTYREKGVAEFRAEFNKLKNQKKGPLSLEARCKLVGREDDYNGLYALLCLEAHNNSAALGERHISEDAKGRQQISFFPFPSVERVAMHLGIGIEISVGATQMMHEAYRTGLPILPAFVKQYGKGQGAP